MKTSIIISTLAVLSLMLNLGQTVSQHKTVNNTVISTVDYTYLPAYSVSSNLVTNASADTRKEVTVKTSLPAKDLSYLKFDVANYSGINEMAIAVADKNSFDYLRFDVNKYSGYNVTLDNDALEMPANDFDYLKFSITEYTENDELNSFDAIEIPTTNSDYLKFDVNNYIGTDKVNSSEITELPDDEYNYLKFDVNTYPSQDSVGTESFSELPEIE